MTRQDALRLLDEHLHDAPVLPEGAVARAEWLVQLVLRAYEQGRRMEHQRAQTYIRSSKYTLPEQDYQSTLPKGRWVRGRYVVAR